MRCVIFSSEIIDTNLDTVSEVNNEKQLSKLIDRAFMVDTIEDFVRLVGQQASPIKKKIGEIVLCCQSSYFGPRQYCLKGKRLYERVPKKIWSHISQPRSCHSSDSVYLANELGRPFHKILALPLDSPYNMEKHRPLLYIEYLTQTKTIERVFSNEKREILKSAFSRVLLEEHWRSGCELWQNTFDSLDEPLVILDDQKEPVRSNTHFHNIYNEKKELLEKETFQWDGQTYERQKYSVSNDEKLYTIEHFVNKTSDLLLREQMAQHQRMSILGQIADDIAHKLNNPLTGIRSMAQILSQELNNIQDRENFVEIEKAAHRCQKIIRNFIQFSKQSSFDSTCDLNEIIHQTIPFLKTMIKTKKLVLELNSKSVSVKAEPCLLQQVIFNLVKNALEAVGEDGIVIIKNHIHSSQVGVSVTDNGCGISEKYCQKLFDPFFTTKKNGTGLGLRISRQLIEKFGGELKFESTVDQGSCFTFYLSRVLS